MVRQQTVKTQTRTWRLIRVFPFCVQKVLLKCEKKKILPKALNLEMDQFKETKSATMNIFSKKEQHFLLKSFVKAELNYVFTVNLFTIAENCMEK